LSFRHPSPEVPLGSVKNIKAAALHSVPVMENKTLAELKLIRWLKNIVNSKEEYDSLCEDEKKILSSCNFCNNQKLKGGARKW
jgi:hypothetical protein